MINGKELGETGFKYLGVPYSKMDCQAFAEQCLRDCGLEMNLAGSNAWYREVMKNGTILTPEECVKQLGKVPAGAFLFIHAFDGGEPEKYRKDGLGNACHIGIVTGRGEGAIHSSASRGCVAESRFNGKSISGGWNRVGLWNRVSYDYGTGSVPAGMADNPVSEPVQEPESEYAVVWAGQGSAVNTRQGPGTLYALSKAGRIPVGTTVEIQKRQNGWCRIRYVDPKGAVWFCWMKEEFLKPAGHKELDDPVPGMVLYTAVVSHLTLSEAETLKAAYPDCTVREEAG